ncbi:unnamed protein product [Sympodiomycopsis kandeliae]
MPRAINPTHWRLVSRPPTEDDAGPLVQLRNPSGHIFSIHPINENLVRVVHQLPSRSNGIQLRDHIHWERVRRGQQWNITSQADKSLKITSASGKVTITVDYAHYLTLSWYWHDLPQPFLQDFKKGYTYDSISGRVYHYTCRGESYIPTSEHIGSELDDQGSNNHIFTYGLGESKGRLDKTGSRYTIDGRDSLAADPTSTDPLYKLCPFYTRYNSDTKFVYGIYYNTLNPSTFDFGAEHDFSTGDFDVFSVEHGPLDYYVLLGHQNHPSEAVRPTIPAIITQFARLVTPPSFSALGHPEDGWQVSPTLPRLSQFGYLASSLTLSERTDAQNAVIEYVDDTLSNDFPIDAMHLSSGYCQDEQTKERLYFHWNKQRYPDPAALGESLEKERKCQIIINVKPWLLTSHPQYDQVARLGSAFVKSTSEDEDTQGMHGQSLTLHWSSSMGQTAKGSYFDLTSQKGCQAWAELVQRGVLDMGITGVWIDNNEYSTLIDDGDVFTGEVQAWEMPTEVRQTTTQATPHPEILQTYCTPSAVRERMSGYSGPHNAGTYGRAIQTMGMARSTYSTLLTHDRDHRPTVITRSAVPGQQAYTQATWSGDNSTTWLSFKWGVKLSLSYSLSFGIGLYGQDIGGFAGNHSPSAELLIRWCQQSMWSSRFTIHSWKDTSTTLWMYRGQEIDGQDVTEILRRILQWRYSLIPTLYSLYVTEYYRYGWSIIRPLLWYHLHDYNTLSQDEQFYLGSHILVAPVLNYQHRSVTFHLPTSITPDPVYHPEEQEPVWWYDPNSGSWISPTDRTHDSHPQSGIESSSRMVTLEAPIDICPYLIRGGAILVRSRTTSTLRNTSELGNDMIVDLYPSPPSSLSGQSGKFTLVKDDGISNTGQVTEIFITFQVVDESVEVSIEVGQLKSFKGEWKFSMRLPRCDTRFIRWGGAPNDEIGSGGVKCVVEEYDDIATKLMVKVTVK